jgi:glycosyltransferase involved in cell wall biosynthesis
VVLPYVDATQSGVLMTAHAFDKPAIVTDVGGLPEVVESGVTGFVVPARNETLLASAAVRLLKERELRESMKEKIRQRSGNEFSWERITARIMAIYEKA